MYLFSQGGGVVNTFACYSQSKQMPSGRAGSNPVLDANRTTFFFLFFFFFLFSNFPLSQQVFIYVTELLSAFSTEYCHEAY